MLAGGDPIAGKETLTAENRTAESVYLGLRTVGGMVLIKAEVELASTNGPTLVGLASKARESC